ncbi:unnamed protein product [Trifolium pratense]|uniref:Uncharacterized protein n=1 Tax=Trifolium pratense TaxID=57577 RepID=A0ACB0MBD4_TRIPR|nr:unnamed protein product [Trifolium pratense]
MWTTCYDDVRKIGDTQYLTYRDACFAMGFLKDDRVYITAIKEAKDWGSGHYLRKLFVHMYNVTSSVSMTHKQKFDQIEVGD